MALIVIVLTAVQYDYFVLHRLDKKESLIIVLLGTLIGGELYLVLNLLPTHFFMYGIIISLFFYIWFGVCKQILRRKKEFKYVKLPRGQKIQLKEVLKCIIWELIIISNTLI